MQITGRGLRNTNYWEFLDSQWIGLNVFTARPEFDSLVGELNP